CGIGAAAHHRRAGTWSMNYRVTHRTTYSYSEPVTLCHNLLRLTPRATAQQTCLSSRLHITPAPAVKNRSTDYFVNPTPYFTVQDRHELMTISVDSDARVLPPVLPPPEQTPAWDSVPDRLAQSREPDDLDAYQFAFDSPFVPCSKRL